MKLYAQFEEDLQTHMRNPKDVIKNRETTFLKLLHRFSRALHWMWNFQDGMALTFRSWLRFTVGAVGSQHEKEFRRFVLSETNSMLRDTIATINRAPTNVYIRGRRQGTMYIDAAGACRQMRSVIKTTPCIREDDHRRDTSCVLQGTAVMLETLQKHTY